MTDDTVHPFAFPAVQAVTAKAASAFLGLQWRQARSACGATILLNAA
jgi:hypothetical protein